MTTNTDKATIALEKKLKATEEKLQKADSKVDYMNKVWELCQVFFYTLLGDIITEKNTQLVYS